MLKKIFSGKKSQHPVTSIDHLIDLGLMYYNGYTVEKNGNPPVFNRG